MFHGKAISLDDFDRMLRNNGYSKIRCKGSHFTYCNQCGNKIVINKNINKMVARRIIKENDLDAGELRGALRL